VLERTIPRFDRGVCDYFRARTLMSDGGPVTLPESLNADIPGRQPSADY
jgi:hypothetical protein